jgi:site-specific recombinase XerD
MSRAKRHLGTIEDRGDHLRVILYCGGKRYVSQRRDRTDEWYLDTHDRKTAQQFARQKMHGLREEEDKRRRGVDTDTRFSALLDQYRRDEMPLLAAGTQRSYQDSFVSLVAYFVDEIGDPALVKIRAKDVKTFLAWRRVQRRAGKHQTASAEPLSNRTLQKDRAVLHRLFDFAYQLELVEGNPVARVEQPKADPRSAVILSSEQFETLLKKCEPSPQLWLYALLLNETGGRCVSEALHLRWADVDLAGGFIEIRTEGRRKHRTKSGRSRFVPITPRLSQALKDHGARTRLARYHGRQTEWVFHHERDRRGYKAGDRVKSFRHAFDAAQAAAGIVDEFHRHDLRHRRATTWLANGGNAVHVKEALGHSDLRTTMGYTHLAKEHLKSVLAAEPTATASGNEKQA